MLTKPWAKSSAAEAEVLSIAPQHKPVWSLLEARHSHQELISLATHADLGNSAVFLALLVVTRRPTRHSDCQ